MSAETQKVDVVAAMVSMITMGGELVPKWNFPRGTGHISNRLQYRPRDYDGRVIRHKTPSTATVLRELKRAEADGFVKCVGTGEEHNNAFNKNAADCKELYWVLTSAALARFGGAA
jgi:hypothetical protein